MLLGHTAECLNRAGLSQKCSENTPCNAQNPAGISENLLWWAHAQARTLGLGVGRGGSELVGACEN
eukprot:1013669-Pyramimonas_sp.AAC.1